ncbi:hypothetical protein Ocin01_07250 [Orchesella cincta]|uniref:Uncharacterized protein n=1 Tax=Orchesella cincta TaxID=48709 RepID=A0A1D2N2F0_ORCCI|nr:hypothetical protein Ocin01_07250 [Orchesella cincta]
MVFICCFQCDPRLATYIISILSFLHFSVESVLLVTLDEDHRLVEEDDGIKFYTVFFTHLYLLFSSVLLFFGAHYMNKMLCIPWVVGNVFNLLILTSILLLIFMRLMNGFDIVELEKAGFILLTIGAMIYATWIVMVFFWELNSDSKKSTKSNKSAVKSMFTLYDDDDEEAANEDLLPNKDYFSKRPSKDRKLDLDNEHEERVPLTEYGDRMY